MWGVDAGVIFPAVGKKLVAARVSVEWSLRGW